MRREEATPGLIDAVRVVLAKIAEVLEAFPAAVIVGGTVPYLLIPQDIEPHEGTVDIDVVLALDQLGANDVFTLHEMLERKLFQQDPKKPFRYTMGVSVEGEEYTVLIELLGGGEPPASGMRRIQTEDVHVSIIRGMEVALENPSKASLPDDPDRWVSVASIPAFLTMKAAALAQREEDKKAKDAYDIVYCLRNYPGGVHAIAEAYRTVLTNPIVSAGIMLLRSLFESGEAAGPLAYARRASDAEERALMQREAFERVKELLNLVHG